MPTRPLRWYQYAQGDVHAAIAAEAQRLIAMAGPRWEAWKRYEDIYQDRFWEKENDLGTKDEAGGRRLTINRSRVLCETYTSKLLKSRVLPMVVVKDGDIQLQKRARDNNLFLEGAFDDLDVYDQDPLWATDTVIAGTYFAQVYPHEDKPVIERVDPFEILLDDTDWQYCDGRSIFRCRVFDKGVLAEAYPDREAEIMDAPSVPFDSPLIRGRDRDDNNQVLVIFAWHRRSGENAKDGRYSVVLENCTLEDDTEWDEDELPFAWGWRIRPRRGMWGHPLMADLATPQQTLDKWTRRIDESMNLMVVPRVFVRAGAEITVEQLDNGIGNIIKVPNLQTDIVQVQFDGISPQAFTYMQSVEGEMQTLARTSLLSTQGQVPSGIKSGVAMRIMEETDAEGLREPMRFRDRFFVRIAQLVTKLFDKLGGFETMARAKGERNRLISYSDVKLEEGTYRWAVVPTSFKARSPQARLEQAQELVAQGLLSPDQVANFVDITDLEDKTNLITAQDDMLRARIDRIIYDGDETAAVPTAMMDLAKARKMIGQAWARAEFNGVEEEKLDLLVAFADAIGRLQNPAPMQAPAMTPPETLPGMGAPPGAPPGSPMPPPMPGGMPPMPPQGMGGMPS